MTRKLQILRGTTAQNNAYTGAVGELTMDTDRNEVRIHDGQTVGGIKIGDRNMPILTSMFFDHVVNDMSWLRADTFSWQSGDVYKAAYEHLLADYNSSTLQTDTIGDITITYALSDDGHKICLPDQESNIVALYEATGVAWYFILDTVNKQFKLPRTKHGFTGLRDSVGNYVPESVPNITGEVGAFQGTSVGNTCSGAFQYTSYSKSSYGGATGTENSNGATFDASLSSSAYKDNAPVQERATQMYLYFYVGYFGQTAIEQTAGVTTETLNRKADIDLGNLPTNIDYVVESQEPTSSNSYTWYRKYKSGWVEQGGGCTVPVTNGVSSSSVTVTLPVPIATPEQATLTYNGMDSTGYYANCEDQASVTTTTVTIGRWNNGSPAADARYYNWNLSGMSAQ